VSSDAIAVPDYKIVTKSGQILLVEVKNFRMRSLIQHYTMEKPYLAKLQRYADLNQQTSGFQRQTLDLRGVGPTGLSSIV